uniref:transcription repressor OFP8-like n=1 Tax=Erigeron canadensis TaxID=72917 RepID=UPI001CB901A7|nr:transcription repressor OFP8-like [Erigeron canadensis]
MENRFKLQISKILQSTFNSCRPKDTSDVSDHHSFIPETRRHRRLIDLFSPKPQPHSSSSIIPKPHLVQTQFPAIPDRRRQYSVSPASQFHEKTSKRDRKKKPHYRKRRNSASFSSITDNYYHSWWSSEDDDDNQSETKTTNTLFSRRSGSSDSGNVVALNGFAVAKDTNDPYEDFRVSMVDMIVEKGIFGVEELENLVECFISLNSEEHHKVIFEVFAEIWESMLLDLYNRGTQSQHKRGT